MLSWDLRGCSHAAPFFYTNCWKSPNCSFRVITHIRDSQLKLSKTALQRGLLRQHARKIRDPNLLKNSRPKHAKSDAQFFPPSRYRLALLASRFLRRPYKVSHLYSFDDPFRCSSKR